MTSAELILTLLVALLNAAAALLRGYATIRAIEKRRNGNSDNQDDGTDEEMDE